MFKLMDKEIITFFAVNLLQVDHWLSFAYGDLFCASDVKECVIENCFSYLSTKTYVVGTQKNRLNETVLLSTQNICLNLWIRK